MQVCIDIVQQVGFPIFVAVYLLHIHSKKLVKLHVEQSRTNLLLVVLVQALAKGEVDIPGQIVNEVSGVIEAPE